MKLQRLEFLRSLPYVKEIKNPTEQCEGYKWSHMPMKAVYNEELKEEYRCTLKARWKFIALKKSHARDGKYCTHHLYSAGIITDMDEEARTTRYWKKFQNVKAN